MPFADTMICDPLVDTLLSVERAAQYGGGETRCKRATRTILVLAIYHNLIHSITNSELNLV